MLRTLGVSHIYGEMGDVILERDDGKRFNLSCVDRLFNVPSESKYSTVFQNVERAAAAKRITNPELIKQIRWGLVCGEKEITW